MKALVKSSALYAAIILVAAIAGVIICEIYVRVNLAARIDAHFNGMPLWLQNQTLTPSDIDRITGNRYEVVDGGLLKANTHFDMGLEVSGSPKLDFSVRTNNLGLLSDRPVTVERRNDAPEFRILMFGDSLTGTVTANYEWVDTVEELLNGKKELRAAVQGRTFRIYNLGVVAAGFSSFWKYYEQVGARLDPDLLVVNFINDDFPRREGPRFSDSEHEGMVSHAVDILQRFQRTGIPLILTQMPMYYEIVPKSVEFPISRSVEARLPGLSIVDMRQKLPLGSGPGFVKLWYNLPYDHHMSDYGGELYARAMAEVIAARLDKRRHSFAGDRSAFFDPANCMPSSNKAVTGPPDEVLAFDTRSPAEIQVREKPVSFSRGWTALAGGVKGGALAAISFSMRPGPADSPAEPTVVYRQLQASTYGSPSITKTIGSATMFAGEAIEIRFWARGQGASQHSLNLARYHGAGSVPPSDEPIDQIPFIVGKDWSEIIIPVGIPRIPGRPAGPGEGNNFRLQIVPADPASRFELEIAPVRVYRRGQTWSLGDHPDCANRPREVTAVRRILNDPKAVAALRAAVKNTLGRAKVYSLRPYAFFEMAMRGIDPLVPPLTKSLSGGFVPVRYGDGDDAVVYLNIFCTSGKVAVDNPACYTNQHFFVR